MRHKITSFFLLFWLALVPAALSAQQVKFKNFREAKNALKNNKTGEVDKILNKLTPADSIEKHYLTGMLRQHAYEQTNVKLYYGNKVDTASVFKTLYAMYDQYERAYPHIRKSDSYAKPVQSAFQQYQNNLRIGGNYFISHEDYDQAYRFYALYLRLYEEKLITPGDSVLNTIFGNAVIAASRSNRLDESVRLAHLAHDTGHDSEDIDFHLCDALRKMNRQEEWVAALKVAIAHHPVQFAFYGMLIDYYLQEKHVDDAQKLADDLLQLDPERALNCFVKGYVCQNTKDYEEAVKWLRKAVSKKPDYIPAMISLGFCLVEKAENVENSIDHFPFTAQEKEQINAIYREAEGVLEQVRDLAPDEIKQWGASLWKTYYKLNEGVKLEMLEKQMKF